MERSDSGRVKVSIQYGQFGILVDLQNHAYKSSRDVANTLDGLRV